MSVSIVKKIAVINMWWVEIPVTTRNCCHAKFEVMNKTFEINRLENRNNSTDESLFQERIGGLKKKDRNQRHLAQ